MPGELLGKTATTNLQRTELAEPRAPTWLLSFPLPFGKVFPTLSNIITLFGASLQEATSWLQISFFILLLAGASNIQVTTQVWRREEAFATAELVGEKN